MSNYPQIDGELTQDEKGIRYYNGKRILFNRVRDNGIKIELENGTSKYLRGPSVGVVVALDKDRIGFSQVHSKLDHFNLEYGLRVAIRRALSNKDYQGIKRKLVVENGVTLNKEFSKIPQKVQKAYIRMQERAQKFFK